MNLPSWVVFCHCLLFSFSSTANPIDSLESLFHKTTKAEEKIDILLDLSSAMTYENQDKHFDYANQAYLLYHQANLKNDTIFAEVLYFLGSGNQAMNQNETALELFDQSNAIIQEMNLPDLAFSIFNSKGMLYNKMGHFDLSIENYQKALTIAEKQEDKEKIGAIANNISIIYSTLKAYDKAKELLQKGYEACIELKDEHGKAIALSNIGDLYFKQENWDKAIFYFEQASVIVDSLETSFGIAYISLNLGLTLQKKEQLELAKQHISKAYKIALVNNFTYILSKASLGLAEIKIAEGDYLNSVDKANEALEIYQKLNNKNGLSAVYKCLSENYEAMGYFETALTYRKQYEIEQDSFFDEERIANFAALEFQFDSQKKDAENTLLKAEKLKNEATIQQRTYVACAIGVILLFFGLSTWILFFQNKQKKRYNKKLEIKVSERTKHLETSNQKLSIANQELEQFAYITSHDLKEPLRNISSFSSLIERRIRQEKYDNLGEYLGFISQNTRQMHALIEDILAFSKIENVEAQSKTTSLAKIIENTKNDLHLLIKEKQGKIVFQDPNLTNESANILLPFQVSMIFKNLIENGLKYNQSPTPTIKIAHKITNNYHVFTFQDNGIGIDKDYHNKVFEMFKRLHHRGEYNGSGVGLAICKKVVQNIKGQLEILESSDAGTVFELKIPIKMESSQSIKKTYSEKDAVI